MPAIGFPSPGAIVYRVGRTLPSLPIHATVDRADDATTSARLARLGEALGLSGSVRGDTSGWSVQGGNLSLEVQRTGSLLLDAVLLGRRLRFSVVRGRLPAIIPSLGRDTARHVSRPPAHLRDHDHGARPADQS